MRSILCACRSVGLGVLVCIFAALPCRAFGQAPVTMRESFTEGYRYHVDCRVNIKGQLVLPPEKEQLQPTQVAVDGSSNITYDERILEIKDGKVDRTVRFYERMDFERKVAKNDQQASLRKNARRLVILRKNHLEVPFCPHGPLLWDEIDMVRTDVFTPALEGLLPAVAVRPKDSWYADRSAIQELTDLESIEKGHLRCEFVETTETGGRSYARITFEGTIRGISEDGPAQHELRGHLYFDLGSKHLSYLTVSGSQLLLDKNGNPTGGRIEGTCVLSREAKPRTAEVSDAALKGLDLRPNEQNTLLWFVSPEVGVSFLYPRNWHIAGVNGPKRQIGVDEKRGSGMLISTDALAKIPAGSAFQQEVNADLARQKLRVLKLEPARTLVAGLETFGVEAEANGKRMYLQYFLVRQKAGGAVLTANIQAEGAVGAGLRADVERIARSLVLMTPAK
jgi:hypothetical protein